MTDHTRKDTIKLTKTVLSVAILLTSTLYANQPSFDCSKVEKKSSEGLICSSDELMDIDRELATVYKQALAKASEEDMLKAHQRGWIKGRNDCWKAEDEKACMLDQYQLRIKELKEKYGLSDTLNGFDKVLKLQGITFHVQATNEGSLNQLTITPSGLEIDNRVIEQEIDGSVTGAEVADINGDGSPEIYVYVTSAGSGSYGTLVAYSANNKKSLSGIYLPPLEDDKKNSVGYMGHDEFAVIENSLARRFPVYNKEDSNAKPTGGTRQLEYKLVPGEASWQLKLVNSTTY
ncbi:PliI family lysozyme inhibitor of I-type lysozyme [Sulfurovum sp. NBC37-1]|uniref:PliI family lysozyme inhibitor of I-type lysozyme n=1 Tax=Sulfurovum sp. (strain NBC37-1) TaxID=387093 RepID=UPI00032476CF|nr:PliI family lysozyme inhibitor of I-type lysozyme [Sulfurovum sp. NBC37-1]